MQTQEIDQSSINARNVAAQPCGGRGASRVPTDGAAAEGSTPSNTDPSGTNTRIWRHGIDSLYLSYKGAIRMDCLDALEEKKKAAQSDDIAISATAQISIAGHMFEVKDKGGRGFAYIIEDNAFKISLNKSTTNKRPMAYAKISSEYLTLCGVVAAVSDLFMVMSEIASLFADPIISRVDLCADFSTNFDFEKLRSDDFVTKCEDFATFEKKPSITGMNVGMGGDISFRLYNKTIEMQKNPRPYLPVLWAASGWGGESDVWRAEFQAKREALKGMKIDTVADLITSEAALWHYFTDAWLRIVEENPDDTHRDRWPSHPFWNAISGAFGSDDIFPLSQRFKNYRAPDAEKIIRRIGSGIASYMAVRGYNSLPRALDALLTDANSYFSQISRGEDDFSSHIAKKTAEKCKTYNLPQPSEGSETNNA